MAKNEIENKIKNKIQFVQEAIDTDQLWDNIEGELPTSNKRKVLFWIFLFGLLLIGSLTVYKLNQKADVLTYDDRVNDKEKNDLTLNVSKSNIVKPIDVEYETGRSETVEKRAIIKQKGDNILNSISTERGSNKNVLPTAKNTLYSEKTVNNDKILIKSESENKNDSDVINEIIENEYFDLQDFKLNIASQLSESPLVNSSANLRSKIKLFKRLPTLNISFLEKGSILHFPPLLSSIKVNKRKSKFAISLELTAGYALPSSKQTSKDNSLEIVNFIKEQTSSLKLLEAFDFEILGKMKLKSGFYFKSGLSYMQLNEQYLLSEVNLEIINRDNEIIAITTNSNGEQFTELGSVQFQREIKTDKYYFTTYETIQIPIILGSEIQKGRYLMDASVGTNIGITFNQNGIQRIYNEGLVQDPKIYKPNLNLSGRFEVGFGYKMTKTLNVWSRLNYFSTISSITNDSHKVSQQLSSIGAKISLELKF